MKRLAGQAVRDGDPARGERIFRRKEMGCAICHAIGGVGGKVGPDMTSLGASSPVDYLIESVFYPNRKIKEGYHSVLIETKDGEELSGILVRENGEQVVLRNATDREVSIAKNNIKSRALGNSLMPSGLIDSLSSAERLDLFRFLSELGKPGPYDASKGNVARLWKLFPQTVDSDQFGVEKILNGKPDGTGWSPAHSLVDGRLLQEKLQVALDAVKGRYPAAIFASVQVQVNRDGTFHFNLSGAPDCPVWVDGKPAGGQMKADLLAGTHTITVRVDAKKLPDFIKIESEDWTFLVN